MYVASACYCQRARSEKLMSIFFLQFEWAWQHPHKSRRLGKGVARKKPKETSLQYRFRTLTEMLSVGPWCRLALTIRYVVGGQQMSLHPGLLPSYFFVVSLLQYMIQWRTFKVNRYSLRPQLMSIMIYKKERLSRKETLPTF